jgi:ABC-type Fe3+-hydroxamate transport system substrate-binding protein
LTGFPRANVNGQKYHVQARLPGCVKASTAVKKLLAIAAAVVFSACASSAADRAPHAAAQRIVTLMPSFADDLCSIGAGNQLVAVSAFSGAAHCASRLPVVSDFASVDTEKILALNPDAVVAIPSQRRLAAPLQRAGIPVLYLRDDSYADLLRNLARLGTLSGRERAANALVAVLQKRTAQLRASEHFAKHPRVFVVITALPIWTAGSNSYISTLIAFAGGRNAVSLAQPYMQYGAEALLRLQPDAIIASQDVHLEALLDREPWRSLRAVQQHRVFVYPTALLNLPGPRYNEGVAWLIERLRPLAK